MGRHKKQPVGNQPPTASSASTSALEAKRDRSPSSSTDSDAPVTTRPRTDADTALVVVPQPGATDHSGETMIRHLLQKTEEQQQHIAQLSDDNQRLQKDYQEIASRVQRMEEERKSTTAAPPSPPPPPPLPPQLSPGSCSADMTTQQLFTLFMSFFQTFQPQPQQQQQQQPQQRMPPPPPSPPSYAAKAAWGGVTAASSSSSPPSPCQVPLQQPTSTPLQPCKWRQQGGPSATRGATQQTSLQHFGRRFVLSAPASSLKALADSTGSQPEYVAEDQVITLLEGRMPVAAAFLGDPGDREIEHATYLGRPPSTSTPPAALVRILFTVNWKFQADAIVEERHLLKGTGITIYDVLSPEEQERHRALWPRFLEARRQGKKAQFNRARLVVDGNRVEP